MGQPHKLALFIKCEANMTPETTIDKELEDKLAEYLRLKEEAAKYEALKKELKPLFEGEPETIIGRFKVTGKRISQPEKRIPAFSYWDTTIKPI